MPQRYWKTKIIGTVILSLVATVAYFGIAKGVLAQYLDAGQVVILDGTVAETTDDSMTILTTSTNPIEVRVNSRTVFAANTSLAEYDSGDQVKVIGRSRHQQVTAQVVQPRGGTGYGTTDGEPVMALDGTVTAKTADSFTIRTDTTDVTFNVTSNSRFFPGNLHSLRAGDAVLAMGQDSASGFQATMVMVK
jgi:hypothetical protein